MCETKKLNKFELKRLNHDIVFFIKNLTVMLRSSLVDQYLFFCFSSQYKCFWFFVHIQMNNITDSVGWQILTIKYHIA